MSSSQNVDLNFKVPRAFRAEFHIYAARLGITARELLFRALVAVKAKKSHS